MITDDNKQMMTNNVNSASIKTLSCHFHIWFGFLFANFVSKNIVDKKKTFLLRKYLMNPQTKFKFPINDYAYTTNLCKFCGDQADHIVASVGFLLIMMIEFCKLFEVFEGSVYIIQHSFLLIELNIFLFMLITWVMFPMVPFPFIMRFLINEFLFMFISKF